MFIRSSLWIVYFCCLIEQRQLLASCPYIRSSFILTDCLFDSNVYLSLGAQIVNSNSIDLIGYYALNRTDHRISQSLIYHLGHRWMFVVPLVLKCAHQTIPLTFTECQYTIRQRKSSIVEYMTTQLSVINLPDLGMQSVLFLQPGEITLRSCKAYDCSKQMVYLTASNETFNFRINYEKSIGTKCQTNLDCNHRHSFHDLLECDSFSQTCQCLNENMTTIDLPHLGRFCTDSMALSNCTRHPQRCLHWCDQSTTSHCICPTYTRKVRKINGVFDCELEPLGKCRFDDEGEIGINIRKCPTGTVCDGYQCQPVTVFRQIASDNTSDSSESSQSIFFSEPIPAAPKNVIRILVIVILASLLFCVLIIFIIAMLIKARRFRWPSTSDDKISSSSFIHSTSTAVSNEIYQFKPQSILSYDYTQRLGHSFSNRPTYLPGLVPQANLSPRFYRSSSGWDRHYRQALPSAQIRSSSLTHPNQGLFPSIRHLQNGDVLISA